MRDRHAKKSHRRREGSRTVARVTPSRQAHFTRSPAMSRRGREGAFDAQSRSCAARRRCDDRGTLHAAGAADPARRINGHASKLRPTFIVFGFVLSFLLVALAGRDHAAFDFDPNVLRSGAAIMLILFGVLMIWPVPFEILVIRLGGCSAQSAGPADRAAISAASSSAPRSASSGRLAPGRCSGSS